MEFLKTVEAFSAFDPGELNQLAAKAKVRHYELGAAILNAGEIGEGLYVVRTGRVRLFTSDRGREKSAGIAGVGETFGEDGVLKAYPSEYSVRASDKTEILIFAREVFSEILSKNTSAYEFIARYVAFRITGGFIRQMFNLRNKVSRAELSEIVQSIGIRRAEAGEKILTQDSAKDRSLYIVRHGEIKLIREEDGNVYPLAVLGQGEIFGEKAALTYSIQPASAIALQESALLVVPQKTLMMMSQRNPELRSVLEERIRFSEKELIRHRKLAKISNRRFLPAVFSKAEQGERIIPGFAITEQAEEKDCGAACLSMICKYYDISVSPGKLREMANVTADGATMDSLANVGESLGFSAKGVKCTFGTLSGFDLPFIVHWKGYHYIVVYGISRSHVWIADPAMGFGKLSVSEFEQGWTGYCLLLTQTRQISRIAKTNSPWLRFIAYLTPLKKLLLNLFFAALIIQMLGLIPPIIIQNILDRVVVHQSHYLLNMMMTGLAITMIFSLLTGFLSSYLMNFIIRKLDFGMISHFYKYVFSLPMSFFATRKVGDIMARFHENNTIRRFMTEGSISTVLNTLMVFTYFIVMFCYNVRLTLMLMAFLPPMILLTLLATPRYKDYARQTFYAGADAESLLVETLGNPEIVKGMGVERPMRLKWEKKYAKTLELRYRSEMFSIIISTLSSALRSATYVTLLWTGSKMVLSQELSIGQLMAFNALIGSVMTPVMGLVGVWDKLQETLVAMERLGDVLELEPEQKPSEMSERIVLPELNGDIRFENMYFRYGGKETPYILKNINLNIKAGSVVALVGASGSGKSTFAKLIAGFYKPTEGRIYVDDYDINMLDMGSYRAKIGYVMQTNTLFSGTVSENIALGDSNPDIRRISEVAKLADADKFIRNLPLGYAQMVGERGMGLSGGQIQRICIARALYHDPRILIFDEATSSLDTESETHVHNHLKQTLNGKTAIIISHRLSTVMNADRILVLYQGEIAEQGNHKELFAKKGMYFHLLQKQLTEFEN